MATINEVRSANSIDGVTHEGAPARKQTAMRELERAVFACLLWEDGFYESGESIAARISRLVPLCPAPFVGGLAIRARVDMRLRHVPLLLIVEMCKHVEHKKLVRTIVPAVVTRADQATELLALYWKDKRTPLSNPLRRGLADAFRAFDEYQLAKYNREKAVTLRDVLFLTHPKAKDDEQQAVWSRLVADTLTTPDTWEVAISAAKGNQAETAKTWRRLLYERRLGGLALLRNLRNMHEAGLDADEVNMAIDRPDAFKDVLPFRFVAASRAVPAGFAVHESLERAMLRACSSLPVLTGKTVVLVDVSGSMQAKLSAKSDLKRIDTAAALAVVAREVCQDAQIIAFHESLSEVRNYHRGFALLEHVAYLCKFQQGTLTGQAIRYVNQQFTYDRLIVITDEQSQDAVGVPKARGYMINVASERPSIAYGPWKSLTGFSENIFRYIAETENVDKS